MSVHNNAKKGDIADFVLLPGDPQRAKYIAENFLDEVEHHLEGSTLALEIGSLEYFG